MGKSSLLQRLGLVRKGPLSLEAFRGRVIEELRRRRPELQVDGVGDAELHVLGGGQSNLARGYAYYREYPRDLDVVVGQVVDLVLFEPEPAKPEELIVLVRPASFRAGEEGEADSGLARSLAGGLIALVAVDLPQNYRFPKRSELQQELGMDEAAMWERATKNLRARVPTTPPEFRPGHVMGMTTDTGLASSLLVLDDYWAHPALAKLGDLVVAPLERDELVVAPLNEPLSVKALRNIVARRDGAGFLCDRLLLRRNGAWEEFE